MGCAPDNPKTKNPKGKPVAIYHLSAKPISRAAGRSATGAAAYRAGELITDERTGEVHDYTRKGGVLHSELILPGGETADRAEFWNRLEKHHKRGDAVLAREVEISLPTELETGQRQALAVGYARELADRYGVAADVALHAPRTVTDRDLEKNPGQYHETDPETGRRHNGNWHAHITLSACYCAPDGTLGKKAVELDPIHCQRAKIENMADRERARWAELANEALERHGHEARIDHRTLEAQGIDREPSRHLGPAASAYERRTGEPSRKRQDWEQDAAERLTRAKIEGEAEREHQKQSGGESPLDLSGDIAKAKAEQVQEQRPDAARVEALKAEWKATIKQQPEIDGCKAEWKAKVQQQREANERQQQAPDTRSAHEKFMDQFKEKTERRGQEKDKDNGMER